MIQVPVFQAGLEAHPMERNTTESWWLCLIGTVHWKAMRLHAVVNRKPRVQGSAVYERDIQSSMVRNGVPTTKYYTVL